MSRSIVVAETAPIRAPIERCFALSTRVELVQRTLGMEPVGGVVSGHVGVGSRVVWRGWKFGWPTEHHTLITKFAAPHAGRIGDECADFDGQAVGWFEDSQEKGRFAAFSHMHLFRQLRHDVQLEDRVSFALPFGVLGRVVAEYVMAPYVRKLVRQRFAMLKELAEGEGWREWVVAASTGAESLPRG